MTRNQKTHFEEKNKGLADKLTKENDEELNRIKKILQMQKQV